MSTLRKRFRVVIDGEPSEVLTNARDLAAIETDGNGVDALGGFRLVHQALVRTGATTLDLEAFLDVLDELESLDDDDQVHDDLDPTQLAASENAP